MSIFSKRPWLLVVVAFMTLIGAWVATIMIAEHHKPTPVPLNAR